MALTDIQVKNFQPKAKTYRKFDGRGLYVEVTPKGKRYWRHKYRYLGKEKRIAFGVYPTVSLKEARIEHAKAMLTLSKGIDPSAERQANKQRDIELNERAFEAIAQEWHLSHNTHKEAGYQKRLWRGLGKDIFPTLGNTPITLITAPQLRQALKHIEARGAQETAHRVLQVCSRIFNYAIASGYCDTNPTLGLKGALAPPQVIHFATLLKPAEIGALLRAIDSYDGLITRYALQLLAYTFVRPGNIRKAEWGELDWAKMQWEIPAEKMKLRVPHIVPLAKQTITIFKGLQQHTSHSSFIFPSLRDKTRPMSENTMNAALRRLGYTKDQMTGHGFRHMASTLLNEHGTWHPDAIERQLAHTDRSKIRGTYDHSKHLPERREMMQAWADDLDNLKHGADVISLDSANRKRAV